MKIQNDRITGVDYVESPNHSGGIDPRFIVMHYTAGYTAKSAINTLTKPGNASAHIVIDYDGTITQLVPFDVKAWHAGPSKYAGYTGLNSHSIGIEIVNIGWLRPAGKGQYIDAYGNKRTDADFPDGLVEAENPRVGSGKFYWPIYPEAQLKAVEALTKKLVETYDIIDIVSHEEIDTRGWKTDPGPAFPMNRFKRHINHRSEDLDRWRVIANSLNVRSGPGTRFDVLASLRKGDVIEEHDRTGAWVRIDNQGWVHGGYLRRA